MTKNSKKKQSENPHETIFYFEKTHFEFFGISKN